MKSSSFLIYSDMQVEVKFLGVRHAYTRAELGSIYFKTEFTKIT